MVELALDLAGRTGWAIRYETGEIRTGIWRLDRGNLGGSRSTVPMMRLWKRLHRLAEDHDIGRLVIEETFARGSAKFRLDSLQYTAILWANLAQIPWMRISPSGWKKRVLGDGRLSSKQYLALAQEKWPEQRFRFDDEAAAYCLLIASQLGLQEGVS